jgi:hypothetical protein
MYATTFNDETMSTHDDERDAWNVLQSQIATMIDEHVRDEMHDCNECDITIRYHVRYDDCGNVRVVVTHDIDYENIDNIDTIDKQSIIAQIE